MEISQIAPLFGMLGLLMAFAVYCHVVAQPAGTGLMTEIAESIQTGAMAFIRPEPTPHAAWRSRQAPHGLSAVVLPPLIGFVLGKQALGGFLAGATLMGVFLALFMANSGGAWDNTKKYIEEGNLGAKGSDTHKAAVVGDTVGGPFKDTSSPLDEHPDQIDVRGRAGLGPLFR